MKIGIGIVAIAALVAAATLSDRYITSRFLPDKAIDLVDEAASRLRMEIDSRPVEIDVAESLIFKNKTVTGNPKLLAAGRKYLLDEVAKKFQQPLVLVPEDATSNAGTGASFSATGSGNLGPKPQLGAMVTARPGGALAEVGEAVFVPCPLTARQALAYVKERRSDADGAAILEEGLREAGFTQVERIAETKNLLSRIYALDPDVILIDLENPSRDVLEQMFQMSRAVKRPVAMFVDQSDSASIQAAVDAGVSAYIVGGLRKERITNILDLCISRFNAFARLQSELDHAKGALEERKVIDRAKGVLMQARKLTEEKAYALLRTKAMNENKKIVEIAQSVLTAAELLK